MPLNYLQKQATDEHPIAVLTRKKGYIRMDVYFSEGDADIMDADTTDFDVALKRVMETYDAENLGEEQSLQEGPTAHPGQRAWRLQLNHPELL